MKNIYSRSRGMIYISPALKQNSFDTDMRTFQVRMITVRFGILKQTLNRLLQYFDFFFDGFFSCTQTIDPVYSTPFQLKCSLVKPTQLKFIEVIISFTKTHPRTQQQFPLWQITRQETLNKRLRDPMRISMFALIFNNIRMFSEAIKRGVCT